MFKSVKSKIFFSIFVLSLLVLGVLAYICYSFIYTSITRYELEYAISSTDDAIRNIEQFLRTMADDVEALQTNDQILSYLEPQGKGTADEGVLNAYLRDWIESKPYISSIFIKARGGKIYTSTDWEENRALLEERIQTISAFAPDKFTPLYNYMSPTRSHSVFSYYTYIPNRGAEGNIGTLYIDLDYGYLRDLFIRATAQAREKAILVNDTGEIILGFPIYVSFAPLIEQNPDVLTAPSIIDKSIYRQPSIMVSHKVRGSNWILVRIISKEGIYKDATRLLLMLASVSVVLFFASFCIAFVLANVITRPISELNRKIKRVELGDLTVRERPVTQGDELNQLSGAFDKMVVRLDTYLQSEIEAHKRKSDMEFQILQSQINPHFLYNTLDSVKWLAAMQKEDNICNMVSALINTLRYNLSSQQTTALARQEIDSIRDYITIQQYRYGNAFTVRYSLSEEVLDCVMLRFTLQPLVENAIFHGMENFTASGIIDIRGRICEGSLVIEVADNGPGFQMDSPAPDLLRRQMRNKFSGIGLTNINERYELFFPKGFHMELFNDAVLGGACTRLCIPQDGKKL